MYKINCRSHLDVELMLQTVSMYSTLASFVGSCIAL
jgi:hypothetical protein